MRIVTVHIEQVVEFDSRLEYLAYIEHLRHVGKKFKEMEYHQLESGVVRITIRKQYNNNNFPE